MEAAVDTVPRVLDRADTRAAGSRVTPSEPDPARSAADAVDAALSSGPGFVVWRRIIPPDLIEQALRVLNLEIVRNGPTPEEIVRCARSTFFPHLRWEPGILALRGPVDDLLRPRPDEQWADSQLLLRFPDEAEEWPLTPHVDEAPPWADGRPYRAVVGVPLSPSRASDGCLIVWPGSHVARPGDPLPLELEPGDVVAMHPELQHTGTLNRGGNIRYVAYFRLLAAAPADPGAGGTSAAAEPQAP
jgi:hypothetical protein